MGSCAAGRKNSQGFIETDISLAIKDAAQRISMDARLTRNTLPGLSANLHRLKKQPRYVMVKRQVGDGISI